ncbi:MAG: apolipoprotein N-acyltransferase [Candidatus Marinimicrobia bacterium]|nr:apolipoprotein N-acyltransferase [Candidatus Neomarinimicrobiota bacterium]MBT4569745.1 apolipoprotein N-acyltransferase [Candidatus Neomarinimicrobiota bacterium]MBT5339763.1 apolipoprotein N-acyltransferase [Candidatus Neomarinimicrobiota bacterium]MBT6000241.1 apolipoprotein N-acyltransferase [Candidatus Neomarinimicrobiota bacterium]MBT6368478.1 apolipoprotein N-acyltransferase [Candidatus Neomarinimicrobiota bacterium]
MLKLLSKPSYQLAIISGCFLGMSYPPLPLGFFALFGFIPLIHICVKESPKIAAKWGYVASVIANVISLYWIGLNTGAPFWVSMLSMIGAVFYLGIFWAAFAALVSMIHHRTGKGLMAAPFLWVAMEFLRTFGPLGYPWINLAITQSRYLPVIQILEITGTYGVAFWIVLVNAALYGYVVSNHKKVSPFLPIIIFILPWLFGGMRLLLWEQYEGKNISIAMVQPNVNPVDKWDHSKRSGLFALMDSLHVEAMELKPDLILWPESALPTYLRTNSVTRKPIMNRIKISGIPLLAGTPDKQTNEFGVTQYLNSTIFLKPNGSQSMYTKMKLVPFGEYVPLSSLFSFLDNLNIGVGNFEHGGTYTVFEMDSIKFSNMICYDSSFPSVAREFVSRGAQMLTIQTNDGWWRHTSGAYQHFELARLRAVENRVPVVRCANTGISGHFLPTGKHAGKIGFNQKGVGLANVTLQNHSSFYTKFGDAFAWLMTLISIGFIGMGWTRKSS